MSFVCHPTEAGRSLLARLMRDPVLRGWLGANLRRKVAQEYSAAVVVPRWEALFEEVWVEAGR